MIIPNLPPGVRAETFTYANGRQTTIFRAPYESDGPRLVVENGRLVLYYVFAAYVFSWAEGTSQLHIGHGSIKQHMGLHADVTITGRWSPGVLAEFGQEWAILEIRKYAT